MSKTLLRHTLIKKKIDIFVDFLIFIHFHYMKMHRLLSSLSYEMWIFRNGKQITIIYLMACNLHKSLWQAIFITEKNLTLLTHPISHKLLLQIYLLSNLFFSFLFCYSTKNNGGMYGDYFVSLSIRFLVPYPSSTVSLTFESRRPL